MDELFVSRLIGALTFGVVSIVFWKIARKAKNTPETGYNAIAYWVWFCSTFLAVGFVLTAFNLF